MNLIYILYYCGAAQHTEQAPPAAAPHFCYILLALDTWLGPGMKRSLPLLELETFRPPLVDSAMRVRVRPVRGPLLLVTSA